MTGLLVKKYHVAVLANGDNGLVRQIIDSLYKWYNNRIVIKTYNDSHALFEAVNVNKARNRPFDCAVLPPKQDAEKMVLQRSNPALKVIVCKDAQSLKAELQE